MITIIYPNIFKLRSLDNFKLLIKNQGFDYECFDQDMLSYQEVKDLIKNRNNIIIYNNYDDSLWKCTKLKNCLYVDSCPFRSYSFIYDNEGWNNRSRICKYTYWRRPMTKMGHRALLNYINEYSIKRTGPVDNGFDIYIPSKNKTETERSIHIFNQYGISFDQILTDSSFPQKTREIAENFAFHIGAEYKYYKSNGIRLNNCKKIVSDHIESTILAILQGVIPYSFAPSIISGSHATREYMGDIGFYEQSLPISQDYADSVVYKLLLSRVPANTSVGNLLSNPIIYEFFSLTETGYNKDHAQGFSENQENHITKA